jgi:hypothetical protein
LLKAKPIHLFIAIAALFTLCFAASSWAEKTTTGLKLNNYAEVLVDNLQIGSSYSMVELVNLPLEITNNDQKANTITVSAVIPAKKNQKPGYEPIPNVAWVTNMPQLFQVSAQGTYKTDIKLSIPDDPKYLGKKYQVDFFAAQTEPGKGMLGVALGVEGRLLIQIASEKSAGVVQPKSNLDYAFMPAKVKAVPVAVGKKVKLKSIDKKSLELQNNSQEPLKLLLQSLDPKSTTLPKEPGFEQAPDANFLTLGKGEVTLNAGKKSNIELFVEIPDKPEFKGKSFQFLVSANTEAAVGGRYLPVLVTTEK